MLLVVAVLGAVAFTTSVLIEAMMWRIALQVAGLLACAVATGATFMAVRRWGAGDDFWWLDSGHEPDR